MKFPHDLSKKISARSEQGLLRELRSANALVDFSSNDYLGLAQSEKIHSKNLELLNESGEIKNGSTGSRLLTGNHEFFEVAEKIVAKFHKSEIALIFNSGYDANIGFFNSVPQRGDLVLYDELSHASIRDGVKSGLAKSFKFEHNDLEDLETLLQSNAGKFENIYVTTESVFSMDGDSANLKQLSEISQRFGALLVLDEAHATGVFGENGEGLVASLGLENDVFATIITFGKAMGCHGAAILCRDNLRDYLINFARSFIYTTALSPHAVANIIASYEFLEHDNLPINKLRENISHFSQVKMQLGLSQIFVRSKSAVQSAILPGNENVRAVGKALQEKGFDVRPILSPTVPAGQERLRFCLHSYNSAAEIEEVLNLLSHYVIGEL